MKITINGKTYNSLDEIPYDERKLVDRDNNGKIDIIENSKNTGDSNKNTEINIENRININGIDYDSLNDLPEEFKEFFANKEEFIENPHELFEKLSARNSDKLVSNSSMGNTIKSTLAIVGIITIVMLIGAYIIISYN